MGVFDQFFEQMENRSDALETQDAGIEGVGCSDVLLPEDSRVELRTDVPGVERALVIGRPFEAAAQVDYIQGDNVLGYQQDCGLTSVANIARLCGLDVTEDDVVLLADRTDACTNHWFLPPSERGGATDGDILSLLEQYGIEARVESAQEFGGSLEAIAQYCENGQRVTMGLNAGLAWDSPMNVGDGSANHQVTVLGAVRDADTGEVAGLYLCDSGSREPCKFFDVQACTEMYSDVPGASIIVTNQAYP